MARKKTLGYRERDYVAMPRRVLKHQNFKDLSGNATKLLMTMFSEYRGHNNGDLSAAFSQMKDYGFKSTETLQAALAELIHYKFLIRTFAGGSHHCSLYAVTWLPIMPCGGKLQEPAEAIPRWNEREIVLEKWIAKKWREDRKRRNNGASKKKGVDGYRLVNGKKQAIIQSTRRISSQLWPISTLFLDGYRLPY